MAAFILISEFSECSSDSRFMPCALCSSIQMTQMLQRFSINVEFKFSFLHLSHALHNFQNFRIIWNSKGIVKLEYFSRTDAKLPISNIDSYKKWLKCSCSSCDYCHKWCWNSEASKKENKQHKKFITLTSDTCTVRSCIWAGLADSLYNQWRNLEVVIHFLQRERCVYYSSSTLTGVQPNSSDKDIYPTNVWSGTYPSHWFCLGIL